MKIEYEKIEPDSGSSFKLIQWRSKDDRFFWHQHPEYEIIYVRKGSGKLHVGNHLGKYEEGEVMFLGPNLPHTGLGYGVIGEHEEIIIQLKDDFLGDGFLRVPEMAGIQRLFGRSVRGISFTGKTRKLVASQLERMIHLSNFERLITLISILRTLSETSEYVLLNAGEVKFDFRHQDEERINRVYSYVEKHYSQPMDIQKVAEIANLTVPSFCRYFKKMTHLTFTDFVNEFRVNNACKLLMEDKPVSDVSFESGFNNISHFNKTFKAVKGMSPREYRKDLG